MMMLASPISKPADAMVHADARIRPGLPRFFDDRVERANRERLVRLVLEELDAPALVVVADQSDERT